MDKKVTLNMLKDELGEVLETGKADVTQVRAVHDLMNRIAARLRECTCPEEVPLKPSTVMQVRDMIAKALPMEMSETIEHD